MLNLSVRCCHDVHSTYSASRFPDRRLRFQGSYEPNTLALWLARCLWAEQCQPWLLVPCSSDSRSRTRSELTRISN